MNNFEKNSRNSEGFCENPGSALKKFEKNFRINFERILSKLEKKLDKFFEIFIFQKFVSLSMKIFGKFLRYYSVCKTKNSIYFLEIRITFHENFWEIFTVFTRFVKLKIALKARLVEKQNKN